MKIDWKKVREIGGGRIEKRAKDHAASGGEGADGAKGAEGAEGADKDGEKDSDEKENRSVEGYAIVFDSDSVEMEDWGGDKFVEVIDRSACTEDFLRTQDVKMTLFHNRESLLARNNKGKGSLELGVDEKGVWFRFEAPRTDVGERCLEGVRRGDLSGCSFTFVPGDYEIEEREGVTIVRHKRFEWMGEMTVGSDPAYEETEVSVREYYGIGQAEQADPKNQGFSGAPEGGNMPSPGAKGAQREADGDEEARLKEAEERALRERKIRLYGYLAE